VLPGAPRRGKSIEIHATVVKKPGSKELRPRWFWDAAGVDFLIDCGLLLGGPGTFVLMCWGLGERLENFKLKFAGGGRWKPRGEPPPPHLPLGRASSAHPPELKLRLRA